MADASDSQSNPPVDPAPSGPDGERKLLRLPDLDRLIGLLRARGFRVIGPTVRDATIMLGDIESAAQLPSGWAERVEAGFYRVERRDDAACFAHRTSPESAKRHLFPPAQKLWRADGSEDHPQPVVEDRSTAPRLAFLGLHACDLAAIAVQDKVFMGGAYVDHVYATHRRGALIIAVQCTSSAPTCFCDSMGTGPHLDGGCDLGMTELIEGGEPVYVVHTGSEEGAQLLAGLAPPPASHAQVVAAEQLVAEAAAHQKRRMQTEGIKDLFYQNYENPRWEEVARRCLTCANCTMVCPTCFCANIEDGTDLSGRLAERRRRWDSCYTLDFSYIHGGSVRYSPMSRYRQWLTHKLATWIDQFGTSGCVGCGRCIVWCPVGIDLTEEVAALRMSARAS
ncbi:4Fe-4S dicluster domain-containing protein [bacterium]|nr:4Fe-4S dicluster domain-containing protein [bacterium]